MKYLTKSLKMIGINTITINILFMTFLIGIQVEIMKSVSYFFVNNETWIEPIPFVLMTNFIILLIITVIFSLLTLTNILFFMSKLSIENQNLRLTKILMCIKSVFDIFINHRLLISTIKGFGITKLSITLPTTVVIVLSIINMINIIINKEK